METLTWIFTGLLVISLFFFILSMIKNWSVVNKISRIFILPFVSGIILMFLKQQLPAAAHILFLSVLALGICCIGEIFLTFENQKILVIIGRLIFLLGLFPWIELYFSTFFIYKLRTWMIITASMIYFAILVTTLILSGKNNIGTYLGIIIAIAETAFFNFCSVISMGYDLRLNYILLMAGTTVLLMGVIFYIKQNTKAFKINKNLEIILRLLFITTAQSLIAVSGILMIAQ